MNRSTTSTDNRIQVVKKPISHLLTEAGAHAKKADRVAALKQLNHPVVLTLLRLALDPKIKFLLPEGPTPFKPSEYDEPGILYAETRRLYIFLEGGNTNLKSIRREALWIDLLGALHKDDAKLLDLIKDKQLPAGLKADVVLAAFPDLF
jgi:hypothetical protein